MTVFSVVSFTNTPAARQAILKGSRGVALSGVSTDYVDAATSFFTGMRTPSSLIAGSSLTALFALSGKAKEFPRAQKWLTLIWILYHAFSLLSVILSINVIVVSTATSNGFLLLGSETIKAKSCHDFLMQVCPYEFTLTRWSFFMSLFTFLNSVGLRAIIEFDLLRNDRWRSRMFLVSAMTGMMLHLWSFLTTYCTDGTQLLNLWETTVTVSRLYVAKSSQTVTGVASIAAMITAAISLALVASRPLLSIYKRAKG